MSKLLLASVASIFVMSNSWLFAQSPSNDFKYGLIVQSLSAQTIELFNKDANKKRTEKTNITFNGLMFEQLYFDQFGLGISVTKGVRNVEFKLDDAGQYKLEMVGDIYHVMFSFDAYTSKNKNAGFSNVFEASIGYLYAPVVLKSSEFYYEDEVSGTSQIIPDFEETLKVQFVSTTVQYKMDIKTKEWGIRVGAGIITGGSFGKIEYSIPGYANKGVLGIRTSFNTAALISVELYSFD